MKKEEESELLPKVSEQKKHATHVVESLAVA